MDFQAPANIHYGPTFRLSNNCSYLKGLYLRNKTGESAKKAETTPISNALAAVCAGARVGLAILISAPLLLAVQKYPLSAMAISVIKSGIDLFSQERNKILAVSAACAIVTTVIKYQSYQSTQKRAQQSVYNALIGAARSLARDFESARAMNNAKLEAECKTLAQDIEENMPTILDYIALYENALTDEQRAAIINQLTDSTRFVLEN